MTTKNKINIAFRNLRKVGYFAKQKFWCCQTCGWSAIPDGIDKVVFYHDQDAESINKDGSLNHKLYLAWSGNSNEICKILNEVGLKIEHDGSEGTRIAILPE